MTDFTSASSGSVWILEVEVVRGDVRQDARVVRSVADAAQDDPATGRLEHADLDVAPREDHGRATGTRPVARIDEPLIDQDSVRRRRAHPPAGTKEDVRDQSRTVLLPFVPLIDTIGIRRSSSRSHGGGVVRASAIREDHRATARSWWPVSWAVRDGDTSRSASARAASATCPLLAGPREGDDPVPGIRRAMDGDAAHALAVIGSQAADPRDDRGDRIRPGPRRDRGLKVHKRMAAGLAPRRTCRRPMASSSFTTGSSR